MLAIQRLFAFLGIVLCVGFATVASADDSSRNLSDTVTSFEKTALPPLIASQDFWSASKVYFQLAMARSDLHEIQAACAALAQSLAYYRAALVKDNLSLVYFGDMASDGRDGGNGMQEIRAKFGCGAIQSASF